MQSPSRNCDEIAFAKSFLELGVTGIAPPSGTELPICRKSDDNSSELRSKLGASVRRRRVAIDDPISRSTARTSGWAQGACLRSGLITIKPIVDGVLLGLTGRELLRERESELGALIP